VISLCPLDRAGLEQSHRDGQDIAQSAEGQEQDFSAVIPEMKGKLI